MYIHLYFMYIYVYFNFKELEEKGGETLDTILNNPLSKK